MSCPTDADLTAFLGETLDPAAQVGLAEHVDGCPACQSRLDRLTHDTDGAVGRYRDLTSVVRVSAPNVPVRPRDAGDPTARIRPADTPPTDATRALLAAAALAVGVGLLGWAGLRIAQLQNARDAAHAARAKADADRRDAETKLARLEFEAAARECEDGRPGPGLRRMVESLAAAEAVGATDLARVIRVNLAAWAAERTARRGFPAGATVNAVAFSPDGERVVGVSDGAVTVWNVEEGKVLRTRAAKGVGFTTVAVSPSGRRMAAGARDGRVRVWDADRSEPAAEFAASDRPVTGLAFDGEAAVWITAGTAAVRRWTPAAGARAAELLPEKAGGPVRAFALSADARHAYTGDRSGTVRAWDADRAKELRRWPLGAGELSDLALSPVGFELLAVGASGGRVFDLRAEKVRHAIDLKGAAGVAGAYLPDGRFVVGDSDGVVRVFDPRTGRAAGAPEHLPGDLRAIRARPGFPEYAVAAGESVFVCRVPAPRDTPLLRDPVGRVHAVAFSAKGDALLVAAGEQLHLYDPRAGTVRRTWPLAGEPTSVRLTPDGTAADVTYRDGSVRIDIPTGKVGERQATPPNPSLGDPEPVRVTSPDNATVVTVSPDGTAILSPAAGAALPPLVHGGPVAAVGVRPDGSMLLTAGRDGTVCVWDAATGLPLGPRLRHPAPVTAAAWSPAGDRIATGTAAGHAALWRPPPPPMAATVDTLRRQLAEADSAKP